jgi:hypothetical protein
VRELKSYYKSICKEMHTESNIAGWRSSANRDYVRPVGWVWGPVPMCEPLSLTRDYWMKTQIVK